MRSLSFLVALSLIGYAGLAQADTVSPPVQGGNGGQNFANQHMPPPPPPPQNENTQMSNGQAPTPPPPPPPRRHHDQNASGTPGQCTHPQQGAANDHRPPPSPPLQNQMSQSMPPQQ